MKQEIKSDLSFGAFAFFFFLKFLKDWSRIKGSLVPSEITSNDIKKQSKKTPTTPSNKVRQLHSLPCPQVKNTNTFSNNSEFLFYLLPAPSVEV